MTAVICPIAKELTNIEFNSQQLLVSVLVFR